MVITKSLFFFSLTQLIFMTVCQPDFTFHECSDKGYYTKDSIFKKNLDNVLSSISTTTQIYYGYSNFSHGEDPDKVYVMALCRAIELWGECRSCVENSTRRILQVCPDHKEAIGWYPTCQIRYSDNSIFGVADDSIRQILSDHNKASDPNAFSQALMSLLDQLRLRAKSGNSIRKFANGDMRVVSDPSNFETVYAFVECNPGLSSLDCDHCLAKLVRHIYECCNASIGARILATTCQLEFAIHPLNNSFPPPSSSLSPPSPPTAEHVSPPPPTAKHVSPPHSTRGNDRNSVRTIIIVVVSTVFTAILIITICIILRMRKQRHKKSLAKVENEISNIEMLQFDFNTIKLATNDFSSENKLGRGGFGAVYKGKLSNGKNIAVKRLAKNSQQGDAEFRNAVLLMAKLRHRNLVSLLGFCLEGNERLLIYEFVPNGSLDHILFDLTKQILLDWIIRHKIIVGIARGLLYLHEDSQPRIVHRDLKASNILLDVEMNPKIANFGMAKLFELDETRGQRKKIVGTYGYMAPEYVMYGRFSTKSDVFSFGILVLEILTGQQVNHFHDEENIPVDLLSFVWNKWREGNGLDIIDPTLGSESRSEIMKWIQIGLLCVQENLEARPSIASVIVMINNNFANLLPPSKPAFFMHSNTTKPHSQYSENEASVTDLDPR